jgi:hypothetical protein
MSEPYIEEVIDKMDIDEDPVYAYDKLLLAQTTGLYLKQQKIMLSLSSKVKL